MTARPLRRTEVLGRRGEDAAAAYLRREGMRILDRNWRCRHGELDIVARDRGLLVAVEVKTRSSGRFGSPLEAIGPEKRARLHLLASTWAAEHTPDPRPGPVAPGAPPGARPRGRARPLAPGPSRHPGRFTARALVLLDSAVRPRPRRTPRPRVRVDAVSVLLRADGRCYIRHHRGIA